MTQIELPRSPVFPDIVSHLTAWLLEPVARLRAKAKPKARVEERVLHGGRLLRQADIDFYQRYSRRWTPRES